jgi:hypothetical protein
MLRWPVETRSRGILSCKYVIRFEPQNKLTGADFGESSATRESLFSEDA